jgi:hypothetical protein
MDVKGVETKRMPSPMKVAHLEGCEGSGGKKGRKERNSHFYEVCKK